MGPDDASWRLASEKGCTSLKPMTLLFNEAYVRGTCDNRSQDVIHTKTMDCKSAILYQLKLLSAMGSLRVRQWFHETMDKHRCLYKLNSMFIFCLKRSTVLDTQRCDRT